MIEEQEDAAPITIVLEWKNANEDVEPHAHIDGGDTLNFTYYHSLLPHPSFQVGRMGGVFFLPKFLLKYPH
jgi:hypothetical protein